MPKELSKCCSTKHIYLSTTLYVYIHVCMYVRTCIFITNMTFIDVRCTEAEVDWLQTDSYRNTIWSYRNNMKGNMPKVK